MQYDFPYEGKILMLEEFHNKTKYWKKLRTHSYEKLHYMGEITLVRNLFNAANVTWLQKKKTHSTYKNSQWYDPLSI